MVSYTEKTQDIVVLVRFFKVLYNEEGDYLEIFTKTGGSSYGEVIASGVTIFKDEETDEVIGIGILNFKKKTKDLNSIELNLPFDINFSSISK